MPRDRPQRASLQPADGAGLLHPLLALEGDGGLQRVQPTARDQEVDRRRRDRAVMMMTVSGVCQSLTSLGAEAVVRVRLIRLDATIVGDDQRRHEVK